MLVLVTAALTAIIGIMGLAVDLGFVALERRQLQRAADAAAISGALDLIDDATWGSIGADVSAMVGKNGVPSGTTTACALVDNTNAQVQSNCGAPASPSISGVKVTLSHRRDTYFMRVLGIGTVDVSASAIGRIVLQTEYNAGNAPFIVCGIDTKLASGGTLSILTSTYGVNPSAVGQTFVIHGPQVADCGAKSNSFKGLANQDANEDITTLPNTLYYDTGDRAGPTRFAVNGPGGCPAGATQGCVMILPVATSITGPPDERHEEQKEPKAHKADAVMYLPFYVTEAGANEHHGVLVSATYQLRLDSRNTASWTLGKPGLVSARLVN